MTISVEDNGRGLSDEEVGQGHGTLNIRARADELGSDLTILPVPDGGTRVTFSLHCQA